MLRPARWSTPGSVSAPRVVLGARSAVARAVTRFSGAAMIVIRVIVLFEQLIKWTPSANRSVGRDDPLSSPQGGYGTRDPDVQERIRASFDRQGLMRHMGARLDAIGHGRVNIVLPSRPEITQQHS